LDNASREVGAAAFSFWKERELHTAVVILVLVVDAVVLVTATIYFLHRR
jgi:hypothetical protein